MLNRGLRPCLVLQVSAAQEGFAHSAVSGCRYFKGEWEVMVTATHTLGGPEGGRGTYTWESRLGVAFYKIPVGGNVVAKGRIHCGGLHVRADVQQL